MSDEPQEVWTRQNGEPNIWYSRFVSFLQMGPTRSLLGTVNAEQVQKGAKKYSGVPGAWFNAAQKWSWRARAEAYDEYRRREVFTLGNAYDLQRIERLAHYAERLEAEIDKMLNALPKKPKKAWFNNFLYEKYLQTLEALASETGGRVKKTELGITSLPKEYVNLPEDGSEGTE